MFRIIDNFSVHKDKSDRTHSDPFFTSKNGFKFKIFVIPNGTGSGEGTHVTVGLNLMKGPNDDDLQFPVAGIFTFTLMNWKEDKHHVTIFFEYTDTMPDINKVRVTKGDTGGSWGASCFLPHSDLTLTDKQYVKDDKMCFKISFDPIVATGCV